MGEKEIKEGNAILKNSWVIPRQALPEIQTILTALIQKVSPCINK